MAFDDPQVFDDLKIISNAGIDFNDPTDFDDPQMFGSKGTTIGSIDLIIFDGLVDVIANGLLFVQYLSTCPGQSRGKDLCEEANLPPSSFSAGSRAPPRVSRVEFALILGAINFYYYHLEFLSCQLRVKSIDDLLHASYHHIFLNNVCTT